VVLGGRAGGGRSLRRLLRCGGRPDRWSRRAGGAGVLLLLWRRLVFGASAAGLFLLEGEEVGDGIAEEFGEAGFELDGAFAVAGEDEHEVIVGDPKPAGGAGHGERIEGGGRSEGSLAL
jgi:hypothetical protein